MTILTACVPRGQKNSSIGLAWPFQARIRENPGRSFETGLKPNLHGDELRSLGFPTTLPTSLRMTKLESWPSLTTVVGPTTGRLGRPGSKVTSPDRPSTCRLTTARSPMSRSGEQVYASYAVALAEPTSTIWGLDQPRPTTVRSSSALPIT